MRYLSTDHLNPGMVVEKSIIGNENQILLKSNKVLTSHIIQKLKSLHIAGIFIKDDFYKDVKVNSIISNKLQTRTIEKIEKMDIEACLKMAEKIVKKIQKNKELMHDFATLQQYDYNTSTHSINVAIHAATIAIAIGFSKKQTKEVALTGLLHDIGKIKISLGILNKNGALESNEYENIKNHPQIAYNLLKNNIYIASHVRVGILQHHENENGTGYPSNLKSQQICKYAKLIHITDVYEALISKRSYKAACSPERAIEIMLNEEEKYDKYYFSKFLTYTPFYPRGTTVKLSNYAIGVIIKNNKFQPRLPIVRVSDKTEIDLLKNNTIKIIDIV